MDNEQVELRTSSSVKTDEERNFKIKAGLFLASVTGMSAMIGFGSTLLAVKKQDPEFFNKGLAGSLEMRETGASLAARALRWGTLYAVLGCGFIGLSIWTLSGAKDMKEFKQKMGSVLPRIKRNDPPQGETEFENVGDLLTYLFDEKNEK